MKKSMLIFAAIFTLVISGCNKVDETLEPDNQQVPELKHSSNPIPINGTFTGLCNTVTGCAANWIGRHFLGTGNVSHLGKTTCELDYCVRLEYPSPDPGIDGIVNGPGVLTAANGDELEGYFVGTITMVWDGSTIIGANVTAEGLFYGGTGRFEDASGYVTCTGYFDYAAGGGVTGTNIPSTFQFSGTIQFGAEILDVTVDGSAAYLGSCGTGSNHYLQTGTGTGTLGNIDVSMDYCATTTIMTLAYPYPPITIPIGGISQGTGLMEDEDENELYSAYNMIYRFTYEPFLPATTNLHNDFIGKGDITGGAGDFEGATGKFITFGTQDIPFSGGAAQFPAPGNSRIIGYFIY